MFSLLLNDIASRFNLATHWFLPEPNNVMAAGKQPVGGRVVTPIRLAPSRYKFCEEIKVNVNMHSRSEKPCCKTKFVKVCKSYD